MPQSRCMVGILALLGLLAVLPVRAATLLGSLLRDGQAPAVSLPLELRCGDKAVATAATEAAGLLSGLAQRRQGQAARGRRDVAAVDPAASGRVHAAGARRRAGTLRGALTHSL